MRFSRRAADNWRREVPGARWFKADLHIHTIDDHPGGRAKMPNGLKGDPTSPEFQERYARRFLQALVKKGIQVAGLTPHSPFANGTSNSSTVWKIVEEWNEGNDDDGVPFREKIYALFPGFEPSFNEGKDGLHFLFLFDPEIGLDYFFKVFNLIMGGITPWKDGRLQLSGKRADEGFKQITEFHERECLENNTGNEIWSHLVLASHVDNNKGLLTAKKSQVLQLFDHTAIAGLELGGNKNPEEVMRERSWLPKGMREHGQAFFHGGDVYSLEDIGRRFTWIKLAVPRIEALRQAFVASDSRMRMGFETGEDGKLQPISDSPDENHQNRPWLRTVTITGGISFFGGEDDHKSRETQFSFSPDLTCIIGGSMTGKSTILDGLRIYTGAEMPVDRLVSKQVEARGNLFSAGSSKIEIDCPGQDPTAPLSKRWPAYFFSQNELQRLTQADVAIEDILARLDSAEIEDIECRSEQLRDLDRQMIEIMKQIEQSDERIAEAEQALNRAEKADEEMTVYKEAGFRRFQQANRDRLTWTNRHSEAINLRKDLLSVFNRHSDVEELSEVDTEQLKLIEVDFDAQDISERWERIVERMKKVIDETSHWIADVQKVIAAMDENELKIREELERNLSKQGLSMTKLQEIKMLSRQAAFRSNYAKAHETESGKRDRLYDDLRRKRETRLIVLKEQREAFDRVIERIQQKFGERIRVRRVENGDFKPLEKYLLGLKLKGVSRWWNDLLPDKKPSPEDLVTCIASGTLDKIGMSDAVQYSFTEMIPASKNLMLVALRCPDRYLLEYRLEGNEYRSLNELSGGKKISLLLSLLLETNDSRPLVIDQPEDELDNRFLSESVLPALKRLRGRRQVIVATHNANIVVNGDADMVIQLDADADHGWIACAGTIEEPVVRDAIVRSVDGGKEAFRLRRRKYGF